MKNRHTLLDRQLRDATGDNGELDQAKFLDLVSVAYQAHDEQRDPGQPASGPPPDRTPTGSVPIKAVLEDERVFRDFAAAFSDRFWETDRNFRLTRRWTSEETHSTFRDTDFIGKFIWEIYLCTDGASDTHKLQNLLETRQPFRDLDVKVLAKDGKPRFRRLNAKPYFDDAGDFMGYRGAAKDVTEEIKLKNLSADLFARFESILDNSPSSIILKDIEGRYLLVNRRFAEWHGITREDAIGLTSADILPDDLLRDVSDLDRRVIETRKIIEEEQEVVMADGRRHPVHVTKFPVFDQDGQLTGIGAIATDITERKKVEAALGDSEILFRTAFEQSAVGMAIRAVEPRDSVWLEINQKLCDILGYTRDELLRLTAAELSVPEERETEIAYNEKALRGEISSYSREKRYARKDGEIIWTNIWVSVVLDGEGRPAKIISVIQDITERKRAEVALRESEERFRALMDNSPSAILLKDVEGRYVMANKCWHDWFNPGGGDIAGKTALDFHPKAHAEKILRADRKIMATGERLEEEMLTPFADGSTRTTLLQKFPILDGNGAITAIAAINTDITQYKAMEEQLAHAQKMEAVGNLTGGVAHDFNNLLTVIQGNAQLLAHKVQGLESLTDPILRASKRGAELTQRLLAFSRRQPLRPRPTDLSALVDGMRELLSRTLGETIEISVSQPSGLWPALVDAGQVENALLNLAINSRDAMPDGGRLDIACANRVIGARDTLANPDIKPGDYVVISVGDTGTGMSPEVKERAFEPFFTTKEVGQGSGLGLSMIYGFAKQSGGFITIDSTENLGTTIKLHLPRATAPLPERQDSPAEEPRHGRDEIILLIEDEAEVRQLEIQMLEDLGYRVIAAADAAQAHDALKRQRPDLILSDVVLPGGISGPEFVAEARALYPDLNVIFMSGYPAEALGDKTPLRKDDVLITKPFQFDDLANHLRGALDGTD